MNSFNEIISKFEDLSLILENNIKKNAEIKSKYIDYNQTAELAHEINKYIEQMKITDNITTTNTQVKNINRLNNPSLVKQKMKKVKNFISN